MVFKNDYIIYLLIHTENGKTFFGITNKTKNLLLKHNGIIKSNGNDYTKNNKSNGNWEFYLKVNNLTKKDALDIERQARQKYLGKKNVSNIQRRLNILLPILSKYKDVEIEFF